MRWRKAAGCQGFNKVGSRCGLIGRDDAKVVFVECHCAGGGVAIPLETYRAEGARRSIWWQGGTAGGEGGAVE